MTLITDGQDTNTADTQQTDAAIETATPETQTQETDNQTSTDDKPVAEGEQAEADKNVGAPEQYEFKAEDGKSFDEAVLGAYSEVAKELNLSQDAAQKLLDKVAPVIQARQQEQIEAVRTQWEAASKSDKEFGGDKLPENLGVAKKALDAFGSPELKALLMESGLGNNPEVIRFMFRAGKAISEDKFVGGKAPTGDLKSHADRLYS